MTDSFGRLNPKRLVLIIRSFTSIILAVVDVVGDGGGGGVGSDVEAVGVWVSKVPREHSGC